MLYVRWLAVEYVPGKMVYSCIFDFFVIFTPGFIDTDIGGTPSGLEKIVLLDYQDRYDVSKG